MAFKQRHKDLKEVVSQLRSAVNAHGKQADIIEEHIDSMEDGGDSPLRKYKCKSPNKKMDPMYNGEPGVQKDDFKQFDSPLTKRVSWQYGGETYYGDLIPSMETSTHRYARTHNGKIKTLPKNKK